MSKEEIKKTIINWLSANLSEFESSKIVEDFEQQIRDEELKRIGKWIKLAIQPVEEAHLKWLERVDIKTYGELKERQRIIKRLEIVLSDLSPKGVTK